MGVHAAGYMLHLHTPRSRTLRVHDGIASSSQTVPMAQIHEITLQIHTTNSNVLSSNTVAMQLTTELSQSNENNKLDSLPWFCQHRNPMPHFWGCAPRGLWPHIQTLPKFVYNVPAYSPGFIILCLLVRKLSCWQTKKRRWKDATLFYTLRHWVISNHHIARESQLAWKCLVTPTFWQPILTCEVRQTDPVCGATPGFISRSLQVSVCSGYDLYHTSWPKEWFFTFWPMTSKSRSNLGWICQLVHPYQKHMWCKFGDRRSVTCRDIACIIFSTMTKNALK